MKVTIRKIRMSDAARMRELLNDKEVSKEITTAYPYSLEQSKKDIYELYYEILYIMDYLFKEPGVTPLLASIVQISSTQYNFYQIFLFPLIHVADFFIFGGLLYIGSRLLRLNIETVKTVLFFVFIFDTIGLVSAVTDTLSFVWESELLIYAHPITGVVFFGYLTAFIHKQGIQRWKSVVLSVIVLTLALLFRIIFLG